MTGGVRIFYSFTGLIINSTSEILDIFLNVDQQTANSVAFTISTSNVTFVE